MIVTFNENNNSCFSKKPGICEDCKSCKVLHSCIRVFNWDRRYIFNWNSLKVRDVENNSIKQIMEEFYNEKKN